MRHSDEAETTVRDIKCATWRHFSAEDKIRIVIAGLRVNVQHRPWLLSDDGPSHVSADLGKPLERNGMVHTRGKPYHPMTQGRSSADIVR